MAQTFAEVVIELLERRQAGLSSANALAKRLGVLQPGGHDSWRKTVREHLSGDREPREPTITLYARVFCVSDYAKVAVWHDLS